MIRSGAARRQPPLPFPLPLPLPVPLALALVLVLVAPPALPPCSSGAAVTVGSGVASTVTAGGADAHPRTPGRRTRTRRAPPPRGAASPTARTAGAGRPIPWVVAIRRGLGRRACAGPARGHRRGLRPADRRGRADRHRLDDDAGGARRHAPTPSRPSPPPGSRRSPPAAARRCAPGRTPRRSRPAGAAGPGRASGRSSGASAGSMPSIGGTVRWDASSAAGDEASNGRRPVTASYRTAPSAQTSAAGAAGSPARTSGATNRSVPTRSPVRVTSSSAEPSQVRAIPKSAEPRAAVGREEDVRRRDVAVDDPRRVERRRARRRRPPRSRAASASGIATPAPRRSASDPPATCSMTSHGASSRSPASRTRTAAGCATARAASISRRNRARAPDRRRGPDGAA